MIKRLDIILDNNNDRFPTNGEPIVISDISKIVLKNIVISEQALVIIHLIKSDNEIQPYSLLSDNDSFEIDCPYPLYNKLFFFILNKTSEISAISASFTCEFISTTSLSSPTTL